MPWTSTLSSSLDVKSPRLAPCLADDRLGEVVVGAGVDAGAEQVELAIGPAGRTWFQRITLPCASGSQIFFSSATVMSLIHVAFGLTTMARPS